MFCTRWFLPLLILPLPITPSYILILYIVSTALHAQACFNCIIVLTALFLSSCYWQPVPIDSLLHTPWTENITTFSQALDAMLPPNITLDKPPVIQFIDRCWCDITSTDFFQPFNVTKWESDSLEIYIDEVVKEQSQKLEAEAEHEGHQEPHVIASPDAVTQTSSSTGSIENPSATKNSLRHAIRSLFTKPTPEFPHELPTPTPTSLPLGVPHLHNQSIQVSSSLPATKLPWYQKEYNLQPYGFDVVFEFGWDRKHS